MRARAVLAVSLGALTVVASLATSFVQTSNHARAQDLARIQREWEMAAAANAQMRATVSAHVWGVPNEELDVLRAKARRPARKGSP